MKRRQSFPVTGKKNETLYSFQTYHEAAQVAAELEKKGAEVLPVLHFDTEGKGMPGLRITPGFVVECVIGGNSVWVGNSIVQWKGRLPATPGGDRPAKVSFFGMASATERN